MGAKWLETKRYVVFSKKAGRFVSITNTGVKRWRENTGHFIGPMPKVEAFDFVRWLNHGRAL